MRLIDDLRRIARFQMPHWIPEARAQQFSAHCSHLAPILQDLSLPVIVIDNVADYYFRGTDQEFWNWTRDFPNVAPPFPAFWLEHKFPRVIESREYGRREEGATRIRIGFLCLATPIEDVGFVEGHGPPEGTKWVLWLEMFLHDRGPIIGPVGSFFFAVDAAGAILGDPLIQTLALETHNQLMQGYLTSCHPPLLAVCFLHCRNVQLVDNDISPKLAKRTMERHGYRPAPYKTLIIEPLKEILRTKGGADKTGLARAMHICRGHFRDYRMGKGLFGKYHQLVWTPATVRGTGRSVPPREMEIKL